MDALPPESPTSLVQRVDHVAQDAHRRILDMKRWLAMQQDDLPVIGDVPTESERRGMAFALNLYWSQAVTLAPDRTLSRIDAFQSKLTSTMLDVATLQHADGTLDDDAFAVARDLFRPSGPDASRPEAYEVTLGGTPYAGALMVTDTRHPDKAVLFMSDYGWRAFSDINEAHAWIARHLRQTLRWRIDLPGLSRKDIDVGAAVTSRRIQGDAFKAMTDRLIAVQKEKMKLAWFQASLDDASTDTSERLADDLRSAFDLADFFDADAILAQGDLGLIVNAASERLARLPSRPGGLPLADLWREADAAYFATRKAVNQALIDNDLDHDVPELYDYAAIRLKENLRILGVTTDPREIVVTWDRSNGIATAVDLLTTWGTTPTARMSLIELACVNVPELHLGQLSATDSEGHPIPQLSNAVLWALVRTTDLGDTYPSAVESGLRSGADGKRRKEASLLTRAARMRFEAIEAHVGHVLDEETVHRDITLSERGFRWVTRVLDTPTAAGRSPVYGKDVEARQVIYGSSPLQGIVEIGLKELGWADPVEHMGNVVYYTPGAPDGLMFREYRNREEADRLFFRNPAFIDYLLDRLPADIAEVPENQRRRRFKAPYGTMWVFNTQPPEGVTAMGSHFTSRPVSGNILETLYDATIDQLIRDVRVHTRSTARADDESVVGLFTDQAFGVPMAPRLAVSAVTGVFQAPAAAWRSYDHVKDGQYDAAFIHATDAYNLGLGATGIAGAFAKGTQAAIHTAAFRSRFRLWHRPATPVAPGGPKGLFRITDRPIVPGNEPISFDHVMAAVDGKVYRITRTPTHSSFEVTTSIKPKKADMRAIRQWQRDMRAARRKAQQGRLNDESRSTDVTPYPHATNVADRFDRFVDAMKEQFPDAIERRMVIDAATGSGGTGGGSLTATQREGLRLAKGRVATMASSDVGASTVDATIPTGYQKVSLAQLPAKLWYYERKALQSDSLVTVSSSGQDLMSLNKARLVGYLQEGGRYGIRLTSADPILPTDDLVAGSQVTPFSRHHTRAVELDIQSIMLGRRPPNVVYDLYEETGSVRRKHYLLVPRQGRDIEMHVREFTVRDNLPPYRGSSTASLSGLDAP